MAKCLLHVLLSKNFYNVKNIANDSYAFHCLHNTHVYAIHDMQIIFDSECFKITFGL